MTRRRILYIGGWGRSGSSVLANILGSHPDAASVGELRYVWDRGVIADKRCGCGQHFGDCPFWNRVATAAGVKFEPALAELQARRIGSKATLQQIIAMLTGGIARYRRERSDELALLARLYAAAADTARVGTLVDASKTPPYVINLVDDPDVELYFIHLVRDPRAVTHSWSRRRATKEADDELLPRYGVLKCAVYWSVFNLLATWFRTRRDAHYLAVRYEDLCERPRQTVESILVHCGLSVDGLQWYSDDVADVDAQHSISGNPSRFDVGRVQIRPDDAWQSRMPAFKRRIVTVLCAVLLPLYGYRLRRGGNGRYYRS